MMSFQKKLPIAKLFRCPEQLVDELAAILSLTPRSPGEP